MVMMMMMMMMTMELCLLNLHMYNAYVNDAGVAVAPPKWKCDKCTPSWKNRYASSSCTCRTHMSMIQALQSRPQNGTVSKWLELNFLNKHRLSMSMGQGRGGSSSCTCRTHMSMSQALR